MSLLFFDGFDGYDAIDDLTAFGNWSVVSGAISSSVRVGTGKSVNLGSANQSIIKTVGDQAGKTLYIGFAFTKVTATGSFFGVHSTASSDSPQCYLRINALGFIEIVAGGVLVATGITALQLNMWYYIECKILVANTGGVCEVKIDGAVDCSFTGDTQWQSTNTVLQIRWGQQPATETHNFLIDDIYILNSDGTANNTYLGEQRCEIMTPTSDSSVAWTRNTGATNYSAVDDAIGAPDDNTTYVSSSTSTQKDEYGLSNLTGVAAVAGVKLITRAEKNDVNPLSFKHGIKSGATNQQVAYTLGIGYANFIDIFETSDGATTAFTSTTVDSLLSTIEVV